MSLVMERGILAIREISISSRFKTSPDNCRGNLFYPWIRTAWGSWQSSCSADGDNQAIQWKTELLRPSKNYCFTPSLECKQLSSTSVYNCFTKHRREGVPSTSLTWRSIMQTKWKTIQAPTIAPQKSLLLRQIRTKGSKKDFHTLNCHLFHII